MRSNNGRTRMRSLSQRRFLGLALVSLSVCSAQVVLAKPIGIYPDNACCHEDTGACHQVYWFEVCGPPYIFHSAASCQGVEACLIPDEGCMDIDALCCPDLGGTPLGSGTMCGLDCNGNGIDDVCDVDHGLICPGQGCPVACTPIGCSAEVCDAVLYGSSGSLSPVVGEPGADPLLFDVVDAPYTVGDVEIRLTAKADLGPHPPGADHDLKVIINGFNLGGLFGSTGNICPTQPDGGSIFVDPDVWNDDILSGLGYDDITIQVLPDPIGFGVWDDCSGESFVTVDITYATAGDCNENHVIDDCEPDYDGDGVTDDCDNCVYIYNPGQEDADLDGWGDVCDNCPNHYNPGQEDDDFDDVGDICDNCPDDYNPNQENGDGDSCGDACDDCPQDPNKCDPGVCGCGIPDDDTDEDGVPDCIDNCPDDPNPGQENADDDSCGDVCDDCPDDPNKCEPGVCGCGVPDDDTDEDGILDCIDNCPLDPNPGQENGDGDECGDVCDDCLDDPNKCDPGFCGCGEPETDTDEDGVPDCVDNCPNHPNPGQEDGDGDGAGDVCDPCPLDNPDDTDCDTVCDSDDLCPGIDDLFDCDESGTPDCEEVWADSTLDCNGDFLLEKPSDPDCQSYALAAANRYLIGIPRCDAGDPDPIALCITVSCGGRSGGAMQCAGQPSGNNVAHLVPYEDRAVLATSNWQNVLITGLDIIPDTTYNIYVVDSGEVLHPLGSATTPLFGDIVGPVECSQWTPPDGYVNVLDIFAWLQALQGHPNAPDWWVADLARCDPDEVLNVTDLQWIQNVISGWTWADTGCSDPCDP